MTRLASKIALAATLAALIPAVAAADPRDHDRRRPDVTVPAPYHSPAPPTPAPLWQREGRRAHELRELRRELRELEARRAAFHARWGWHGRKVQKFERWYAYERAELDRRWHELQYYAWR
mgnify:CR=1 FL=1